ncbi:MAG: exodeoxyribonuclease VII small subunit [Alphaproteobacteria bacterium]|nr:exodeoxyribonuclease VII small subunit [Alphaproteobacteria bacterium]MCB9792925.1 exodeoxyribonuclease VII small subunit [Alphaproteobacteria bacterium]
MSDTETRSFEDTLRELEDRVRRLEAGDQALEDALKLFEEGIALTRECHERLDAADRRIAELSEGPDGEVREREL